MKRHTTMKRHIIFGLLLINMGMLLMGCGNSAEAKIWRKNAEMKALNYVEEKYGREGSINW